MVIGSLEPGSDGTDNQDFHDDSLDFGYVDVWYGIYVCNVFICIYIYIYYMTYIDVVYIDILRNACIIVM